ncbi:glycosyltransferase family 4 protein [Terriglobus sp. RCC_193]|uniref:glycosyltransferase family 4 protein n=1 Tax=Terriglobus sp. RCC_193 TaxID=3239218 RepID=UPI003525C221
MPNERPLLLFVAPYFAPGYCGGVVQIYLGLLRQFKGFRIVVVADNWNVNPEIARDWDDMADESFGFSMERLDAFEFHLPQNAHSSLAKACLLLPSLLRFFTRGRRQWRALCKKYTPSVIVCGGTYSAGWLMPANPSHSLLVNYVHGEELTMQVVPAFLQPMMRAYQRRSLRDADMNIAVSRYTADLITRMSDRVTVLPNFIDHGRFYVSGRREELRSRYGWCDKKVLLTVARLEPRKGIDQALRALSHLKKYGRLQRDWRYVIAGKGTELAALRRLTSELELESVVEFLGFISDEDLPGCYEAADVFLQPNRNLNGDTEGFGVVFLEAAACGLPVIGGVAGGTGDAIDHGRNGLLVDSESVSEIADAIALLLSDDEMRCRFRLHGLAWASHFDIEKGRVGFEKILLQLMQQNKKPRVVS